MLQNKGMPSGSGVATPNGAAVSNTNANDVHQATNVMEIIEKVGEAEAYVDVEAYYDPRRNLLHSNINDDADAHIDVQFGASTNRTDAGTAPLDGAAQRNSDVDAGASRLRTAPRTGGEDVHLPLGTAHEAGTCSNLPPTRLTLSPNTGTNEYEQDPRGYEGNTATFSTWTLPSQPTAYLDALGCACYEESAADMGRRLTQHYLNMSGDQLTLIEEAVEDIAAQGPSGHAPAPAVATETLKGVSSGDSAASQTHEPRVDCAGAPRMRTSTHPNFLPRRHVAQLVVPGLSARNYAGPTTQASRARNMETKERTNQDFQGTVQPLWRPTNEATIPDTNDQLAQALRQLATVLQDNTSRRTPRFNQKYGGTDWEDPNYFLEEMENHFRRYGTPEEDWVNEAANHLEGQALQWRRNYRMLTMTYGAFKERLLNKFDNQAERCKIRTKLYGQEQGSTPAEIFITQKTALFHRVAKETPERDMVQTIMELLRPEVRLIIRGRSIQTINQLVCAAADTEADLRVTNRNKAPELDQPQQQLQIRESRFTSRAAQQQQVTQRPPYPCTYCQGNHFHQDCPRNNEDRRTAPRADHLPNRPAQTQQRQQRTLYPCIHCQGNHYNNRCPNRNRDTSPSAHQAIMPSGNDKGIAAPRRSRSPSIER